MKGLYIAITILVVFGLAAYAVMKYQAKNSDQNQETMMDNDNTMHDDEKMDNENDAMMENDNLPDDAMMNDNEQMMDGDTTMMKSGEYTDYNPALLAKAESGKVVLFFKASWCPTCNALDKSINATLSDIPSDLIILKVDYDNSTELKKKYGVTYQHTLVQVDAQGNQLAKWNGSPDLSDIVKHLN